MSEVMTMKEIRKRFNKEWVLLQDPIHAKNMEIKKGIVLWHCKDRDELHEKAMKLRPKHAAILFMGDPPNDIFALNL